MKSNIQPITTPADQLEDHSPIGFSGWDRHSACHGSVALATLCPKPNSSAAADEGTLAHSMAAYWLLNGRAPKGMDTTMENFLRPYVYAIWDRLPKRSNGAIWMVEGRVAAPSIHPDCRGTVDALIWDDEHKSLQVHDLKYGKLPVEAEGNQQLMGYAVCAMETFKLKPKTVELYIHQVRISPKPAMAPVDLMDLEIFEEEVREHVAAIEEQKAILKKTKDPKKLDLHAGDHCRYCPAWSMCHERMAAAKREGIDLLMPKPAELPVDAGKVVAFALKVAPWAAMILKNAKAHMLKGGTIPGAKLVKGKRVRVAKDAGSFLDDLTTEPAFGGLGLNPKLLMTAPKLKTIPQIEEVIPKDQAEAFKELWEWRDGAPQLAAESDKRDAWKIRPEDYFAAITDGEDEPE